MAEELNQIKEGAKYLNTEEQPQPAISQCIYHLLEAHAKSNSIAIDSVDRPPLTYSRLHIHIENVVKMLNEMGIGQNDRVAIVLPNGPEIAVAFLAVSACSTSAPLNPDYRANEFDFYLSDLNARALIIQSGMDSPAIEVAESRGIPIIRLLPVLDAEVGIFRLEGDKHSGFESSQMANFAQPDDIALVLHTSGTTSRPKIVPLTHANICASAHNIRTTLKLTEADRCLNVMPLFHIHGLMGAVLSSMTAGGSVVCTPGFHAPRFFEWLQEFHPTWYTAVPTIHQAVLKRAEGNSEAIEGCSLRFIRSSSASLPPKVMADLEDTFKVPVIESYGMTEASHQMTSNPLPPRARKPGSVGVAAGPDVAIMDESGHLLSSDETGEIVIRGASVTRGYEDNPEANQNAFTNGWFRTGDQGRLDSDGYLFITGRLKEIINRGGEKISPREVDEVIMDYGPIAQAVTFAIPHARLGEEVAAAVVLHEDSFTTESAIQRFVEERLVHFKVPRRVLILNEIPKGPTGKLQRIGLAEKLGLVSSDPSLPETKPEFVAPRTETEKKLAEIWEQVIGIQSIGVRDNFFDVGGDSILAAQMFSQILRAFKRNLPITTLLHASTIEQLAEILGEKRRSRSLSSMVTLQPHGDRPPFFCIHGCLAGVLNYSALARYLGHERPIYALRARGMYGEGRPYNRFADMAKHYIREIRKVQSEGPYFMGGAGAGGMLALEVAQQLLAQEQKVDLLVLMDPARFDVLDQARAARARRGAIAQKPPDPWRSCLSRHLKEDPFHQVLRGICRVGFRELKNIYHRKLYWKLAYSFIPRHITRIQCRIDYVRRVRNLLARAEWRYVPQPYQGRIAFFLSEIRAKEINRRWHEISTGRLDIYKMPGHHTAMLQEPHVRVVAEQLKACLDEIQMGFGDQ